MSDTTGPYDPNAVEGDRKGGTQYVSRKDVKVVAIVGLVGAIVFWPIYNELKGNSERHRCIANLQSVYEAISLYAGEHDNRYPPAYRTEPDGPTPALTENERPYSWLTDVSPYMNARHSFLCPTATTEEAVQNESLDPKKKYVSSSYGMYVPYGSLLTSLVESPDQVVLVAETSDRGSKGSSDPTPFPGKPDGFAVGWSNTNTLPDRSTQSVTRLAFSGKIGRHGKFIQALSASGQLLQLAPDDATYQLSGIGGVNPHWKLPPGYATSTR